jgi:hypothetical protein
MHSIIRTLFFDSATNAAILVTEKSGKFSHSVKRFADPHAALDWCIKRGARFVYAPGPPALPANNRN